MRRWVAILSAVGLSCATATTFAGSATAGERADPRVVAGPMAGVVPARDAAAGAHSNRSPNLINHGGPVSHGFAVQPIFWGSSWAGYTGDKFSGIDTFYSGLGGSPYMGTNTEYTDATGRVSTGVSNAGHLVDTSAAPNRAPQTSDILAEVAKEITNPVTNGYYPVYVDTPRGHAGYCAWHSDGTIGGVVVQFAFFFNLDNDPGCDPGTYSGQWQSQGLAALGNVSGHEISEAATDPHLDAWYDSSGAENADKCAWTFHGTVKLGTKDWLIQGNWSNNAYNTNSGYTKGGCIV